MRTLDIKNTYKKDLKQVLKQGWNAQKINEVISQLLNDEILKQELKDHALIGDLKDFRECHIFADLVIIYKRDIKILSLYRIGRHQDLFKKY
ncbi:type II toxin-antitoxin system YafQ family toxin [Campylobacter upsaliensis]|uniref:Type II toxin-antitoxin system YafQ family toxin n=1 Tax=Campylobacter upsaliensis TaxID=28080 RepID=A0A7U8G9L3_CAMUP|nr:type II toxin-antitoxin system YafQ family toxin [Campylobacter upsaliensis]EAJ1622822.1 type II toxin-antitoxin system YafQ family toxin [Campylobacter upsaliensis]EAL3918646.1 type II toxin-antitoxin system YafQ family toxin [Campylobacter upsaliensis]ECP5136346.1 type II toxin-antitoxin system YafQ family toxin [Campylobacter upsaliensis]EGL3837997.1 type II toxin-antitoxin system YafQ family toxin [Campylobacter upsaliensis]